MQVKAVLFDLFDTLLLLESAEVYYPPSLLRLHEFLLKKGVDVPFEDLKRTYFEVRDSIFSESLKGLEEPHFNVRVSRTLRRMGYEFDEHNPVVAGATMAFADEFMRYVSLDSDALCVLETLHGKYRLGLVSNFGIPECGWKLLDKFGLKKLLDVVVISGEVNRKKPSPEIFERALKALGVEPSEAIFVGDSLDLDVAGPRSVGMKTVLLRRRQIGEGANINPDRVITSLRGLLSVLEDP